MILNKDYLMRQVKQLSDLLSRLLLSNNEGIPQEEELAVSTLVKSIFKCSKEELLDWQISDLTAYIDEVAPDHKIEFYYALGHFFYATYTSNPSALAKEKALYFYTVWTRESQIFSMVIQNRISELKKGED